VYPIETVEILANTNITPFQGTLCFEGIAPLVLGNSVSTEAEAETSVIVVPTVVEVVPPVVVAAQVDLGMVFVSNVTAPFCANILPLTVAPVVSVTDVKANIFPLKVEFVPSVAELPICQNTLQGCVPLTKFITLEEAVVKVEPA